MKKGIIAGVLFCTGAISFAAFIKKPASEKIKFYKNLADKHLELYLMMNQWVKTKQGGKSIADFLRKKGYKSLAIYGMNYVGETLLTELTQSNLDVKYGIDRRADSIYSEIRVITPDDEFEEVDAIIVTAITAFDGIEKSLSEKVHVPILSLEDILYEM